MIRWRAVGAILLVGSSALSAPGSGWLAGATGGAESGARVAELDEQGQKLEDELTDVKREERENQALTIARGRAYVRLARAGLLPLSEGFDACEKLIAQESGPFCFGGTVTLADVFLIPQMANARRYACDLEPYPTIRRIDERCRALDPFAHAAPERQPDAPVS